MLRNCVLTLSVGFVWALAAGPAPAQARDWKEYWRNYRAEQDEYWDEKLDQWDEHWKRQEQFAAPAPAERPDYPARPHLHFYGYPRTYYGGQPMHLPFRAYVAPGLPHRHCCP